MGNSLQKRRQIKVNNIASRLTKQDKQNLKDAFDRIQDRLVISDYQFRLEVLGPQVPESIAIKLMQLFSSEDQVPEVMNFEDLLACYIVFRNGRAEELGQLCFELMKMTTGSEYLSREHITLFTEKLVNMNEQQIQTFYAKTEFDPRLPIKKEEFVTAFRKVSNLPLFTWILRLVDGYDKENMNMDDANVRASDLHKKLTMISNERQRNETESMGFDSSEHDNMQEFFNKELKKSDAKEMLRVIQIMFKDIRSGKLKRYFAEALTKHKVLDFKYLTNMVFVICKETDTRKKLEFLFDLFSNHTDSMKRKSMRDFAEIFKLGQNYFLARGNQLSLLDFIDDCMNLNIDFSIYEKAKYSMIAMMGLKPANEEEEREAILSALGNNHNVDGYIQEHLEEEDTFYVIEKQFFEAWSMNVGFIDDKSYIIKKEKMNVIDNADLLEPMHEKRMKDLVYGEGFVLVPKFVFFPFSKWYKVTQVIERKVINYRSEKKKALNLFKQRKSLVSGSVVIAGTQQVPDACLKTIGDITYELEVYPKFFYYEKINDKGEKPHQKAIINQKIDQNYVKKVLKQDKLPFYEMLVSRKITFEEVLRDISITFKENHKRGRLWIEDQVISGAKLEMTLEEFGISIGQVIYVEYSNNNNQWPTDKQGAGPASGSKIPGAQSATGNEITGKNGENMKTVGLYNLGNTCYMNSALQCLANTKFFFEYFMREKRYLKQMNLKSKYGHQGELVQNFAGLVQKLYQQNRVVIPRDFKNAISGISEQFQGYDQQDSQEFLSFLLDGLHEELNLRQEKPYCENPDSDDRKIVELGLEQWSNTLRREWSFIFFMFYGQLKSTLNCQSCNKISTTFDIFTNIPLSLPEPSKILLHVIIYRLPNEIKDMIQGDKHNSILRRIDSTRSDDFHRHQSINEQAPANLYKIQESLKYVTNDQPIHIAIRVDKDIKIGHLMQQICEVREVNIDPTSRCSSLVLFSQMKGIIRGIFNPENRLSNYNLLNNEIEAIEVLNSRGREAIKDFYRDNENMIEMLKTAHLTSLMSTSEKTSEQSTKDITVSSSTNSRKKSAQRLGNKDSQQKQKVDKCTLFNSYQIACEKYQDFEDNGYFPDEIYAVAYHRRFLKKAYYFFNPYQPQLLSSPLIFILPLRPTGRRVYEEVWAVANNILKKGSIYHDSKNLWWEQKNWKEKLVKREGHPQQFKPFVLKTVERSGFACSQCSWMEMCSGCILPPTEDYIEDFFKKCHIAIEWHSELIEYEYNPQSNEVIHHPSTQDKDIIDEDFVNLEDCLRKFHEVEEIGQNDHIYCGGCKKPQSHLKKLEMFRPPPILIVQLKRFKYSNVSRNKLNTLVEFPLYNLDVSTFVTDQEFLNQMGIEQKYDLYGMINHYGSLSFGHYVSIVKNQQDNKWYKYDDSTRSLVQEDQIQKDYAYILFYIRKDVQKKTLDDILPNIKEFFPGKPVQTENGNGFVLAQDIDGTFKVQFEKGKDTQLLSRNQILDEKDDNEFHYDAKDMIEIEVQKKEKQQEKHRQTKQRKCRMCSSFSLGGRYSSQNTIEFNNGKKPMNRGKKRSIKQNIARSSGMSQCYIF